MGYKVIHIPYFVQMDKMALVHFFGEYVETETELDEIVSKYPHGFIDESATMPSDFNSIGNTLYNYILNKSLPSDISHDIIMSLQYKYLDGGMDMIECIPMHHIDDEFEFFDDIRNDLMESFNQRIDNIREQAFNVLDGLFQVQQREETEQNA
jgi:hypothetical protein